MTDQPRDLAAEVEAIRREWADDMQTLAEAESCGIPADLDGDSPFRDSAYTVRYLLSALDAAQREIFTLKRCLLQAQNAAIDLAHSSTCFICSGDGQIEGKQCDACSGIGEYLRDGESFIECIKRNRSDAELALKLYADEKLKTEGLSQQIARLTSPPEERGEIVERQAVRKKAQSNYFLLTHEQQSESVADIDTLLGDCAAWRNAHAVLTAERDELKAAKLAHDSEQRAAALAIGILREFVEWNDRPFTDDWGPRHASKEIEEIISRGRQLLAAQPATVEQPDNSSLRQRIERLEAALRATTKALSYTGLALSLNDQSLVDSALAAADGQQQRDIVAVDHEGKPVHALSATGDGVEGE